MSSRRRFIQTNILGLATVLAGRDTFAAAPPPMAEAVLPKDADERDGWNDLPRYVTAQISVAGTRRLAAG